MNTPQTSDINKVLAKRLKFLRLSNNKTQQEVADMLQITRPAYSAYELEQRSPDYKNIEALANYYNVSFDFLFGRENLPTISDIAIKLETILNIMQHENELFFNQMPLSIIAKENLYESLELLIKQIHRVNKIEN